MPIPTRTGNLLLEQAVEAIVPVLGAYGGGAVGALPDVEGAIDRATSAFADRIIARWQDWLKSRSPTDVLQLLSALTRLSADEARQEAASTLDRHLLDIRPEDRSFALDYIASIPAQIKQALIFDRNSSTYHLPPDWSLSSSDALRRFLPMPVELKSSWARGAAKTSATPHLQTQPDAPRTVLPVGEMATPPEGVFASRTPIDASLRLHSELVPKLRVLLRTHWLVLWSHCRRIALNALLLFGCAILGGFSGAGVFWMVYDDPYRHSQMYREWDGTQTYYIKGQKATRQAYDYYRANGNEFQSASFAVPSGIIVGVGLFALGTWLIWRGPSAAQRILDDQIRTIVETNPVEVRGWGGAAVLRQRALVAEILRLEQKGCG